MCPLEAHSPKAEPKKVRVVGNYGDLLSERSGVFGLDRPRVSVHSEPCFAQRVVPADPGCGAAYVAVRRRRSFDGLAALARNHPGEGFVEGD